jgi:hypothetical protein
MEGSEYAGNLMIALSNLFEQTERSSADEERISIIVPEANSRVAGLKTAAIAGRGLVAMESVRRN